MKSAVHWIILIRQDLGCENYDFNTVVKNFVLLIWDTGKKEGWRNLWLLLPLSSDWRFYKLHLHLWAHGEWCKHCGNYMSKLLVLLQLPG